MFRLSKGQWLLLIALAVVGVLLQVSWILLRAEPPRRAHAPAAGPAAAPAPPPATP